MQLRAKRDDLLLGLNHFKGKFETQSIRTRGYCEGDDNICEAAGKEGMILTGREKFATEDK